MYLLTETASPFALERWAAFFANFGQFAKGPSWHFTCLCRNLPEHTLACPIRCRLLWDFNLN